MTAGNDMSDRAQKLRILDPEPVRPAMPQGNHQGDNCDGVSIGSGGAPSNSDVVDKLYRTHFDQLVRLSRMRISNATDAEDLVQDAFLAVRRAYPDKLVEDLRPLLFTVLRNLTVNYLKSGHVRQRRASSEIGDMQDEIACGRGVTPERQLMDTQMLDIAEAVIAGLPARRREALRLHRYDGLTYDQIARRLSVSPRTAKTDVAEALAAIAEGLARAG